MIILRYCWSKYCLFVCFVCFLFELSWDMHMMISWFHKDWTWFGWDKKYLFVFCLYRFCKGHRICTGRFPERFGKIRPYLAEILLIIWLRLTNLHKWKNDILIRFFTPSKTQKWYNNWIFMHKLWRNLGVEIYANFMTEPRSRRTSSIID